MLVKGHEALARYSCGAYIVHIFTYLWMHVEAYVYYMGAKCIKVVLYFTVFLVYYVTKYILIYKP